MSDDLMKKLLNLMDERTDPKKYNFPKAERALYLLLRAFEDKLPPSNDRFHKAFRQCDVTGSGQVDMAIWHLLHSSNIFWELEKRVRPEKE